MEQARSDVGVAVVDGKIYAIGGLVLKYQDKTTIQSVDVAANEEYDPATNTWTYKNPMPTPRDSFAIAVYQNEIYCIGGSTGISRTQGQVLTASTEVYDPANDTWENRTAMPMAKMWAIASVVNGKIYVIGGLPNDTLTEIYDPAADNWTVGSSAPVEPFGPSAVYNGKIYVLWGKTEIFDPATNTWSYGAPSPITYTIDSVDNTIGATTGFMAPKRMYVFSIGSNQVYDPATDSWTSGASIPVSRGDFSVAVVNDLIYVIGGVTVTFPQTIPTDASFGSYGVATYYSTVEQYTPFGYGTVPPVIAIASPENGSLTPTKISLNVTVNRAFEWMGYSLDGRANVTVTGNTTLTGLSNGLHNLTVYAKDEFGNVGASETITFTVPSSFSNALIATVSTATIAVACACIILYFRKKKH